MAQGVRGKEITEDEARLALYDTSRHAPSAIRTPRSR
jgi:hypothetical protein